MRTLKPLIAALALTAVATPAMAAAPHGREFRGPPPHRDEFRGPSPHDYRGEFRGPPPAAFHPGHFVERRDRLDARIAAAYARGDISRREARRLNAWLEEIAARERLYWREGRGLSPREAADLNARYDALSQTLRYERRF